MTLHSGFPVCVLFFYTAPTMRSNTQPLPPLQSSKVLDQLRERIRYLHYSIRTDEVYVYWVIKYIRLRRMLHPASMGRAEVEAFLSWLAETRNISASTHKRALSVPALLREGARHTATVGWPRSGQDRQEELAGRKVDSSAALAPWRLAGTVQTHACVTLSRSPKTKRLAVSWKPRCCKASMFFGGVDVCLRHNPYSPISLQTYL